MEAVSLVARPVTLQFVIGANSFFPILVFNDLLRGPRPGSMALNPLRGSPERFQGLRDTAFAGNAPATTAGHVSQTACSRKNFQI